MHDMRRNPSRPRIFLPPSRVVKSPSFFPPKSITPALCHQSFFYSKIKIKIKISYSYLQLDEILPKTPGRFWRIEKKERQPEEECSRQDNPRQSSCPFSHLVRSVTPAADDPIPSLIFPHSFLRDVSYLDFFFFASVVRVGVVRFFS